MTKVYMKNPLLSAIFLTVPFLAAAQQAEAFKTIPFVNPSFEDRPRASASPAGWRSYSPGSTPDILPGAWGIKHVTPQHQNTCLGLVTREDGSGEDVSQALPEILKANICYSFTLYLSHTTSYVGYNLPVRLRIWGGAKPGAKEQLLTASPLIDHTDWRPYKLQFVPKNNIRYIILEAHYGPGVLFHYKGNILLDNCSAIERCDRA